MKTFGSKELVCCLLELGFSPKKQEGTSHQKYVPAKEKAIANPGQYPFLIVQLGQKVFDPHARTRYMRQIMRFGFTKEEVENALIK